MALHVIQRVQPRQISATAALPSAVEKVCKSCSFVKLMVPGMFYGGRGVCRIGQRVVTPVRCMASPRRVKMVAKQILRELSDMLLTDKVLQYAVLPEVALGADRYLSSLTTISDVEVSGDLQSMPPEWWSSGVNYQGLEPYRGILTVVKVYVSVFGDERGKEVAISGLKSKAKYVRGELGRRMKLRMTPEIRFIEDESIERGSRVIAILDRLKNDNPVEDDEDGDGSSNLPPDDDSDFEDDPDVIYVK